MERMETIANETAELFIRKHFLNLDQKDHLVNVIRNSVKETVINALATMNPKESKTEIIYETKKPLHDYKAAFFIQQVSGLYS